MSKKILVPLTLFRNDCSFGPKNYRTFRRRIVKAIVKSRGGMIVLHEGKFSGKNQSSMNLHSEKSTYNRSWIPDATDQMIDQLKDLGYRFPLFHL